MCCILHLHASLRRPGGGDIQKSESLSLSAILTCFFSAAARLALLLPAAAAALRGSAAALLPTPAAAFFPTPAALDLAAGFVSALALPPALAFGRALPLATLALLPALGLPLAALPPPPSPSESSTKWSLLYASIALSCGQDAVMHD